MTRHDFLNGCRALMELRPEKYAWRELRFYSAKQLAGTLAKEGIDRRFSHNGLDTTRNIPHESARSQISPMKKIKPSARKPDLHIRISPKVRDQIVKMALKEERSISFIAARLVEQAAAKSG